MAEHFSAFLLLFLVSITFAVPSSRHLSPGTYTDKGNPYHAGNLTTGNATLTTKSGAPLHTTVIYPRAAGLFPIVYFIPGAPSGVIPAEWYTDILTRVASHGFIALAVDAFYPAAGLGSDAKLGAGGKLIDKHLHHLEWLKTNLKQALNLSESGMTPLSEKAGLLCHSAGCDDTLQMIQRNSSIATSTIFLEPFSLNIKKQPGIKMPAYMYGTQFAEEAAPFPCNIPGTDYKTYYQQWGCPKWMTEVANFGHCDVLDSFAWSACHIGHFCKTVGNWSRVYPTYHEYASGAISSFFIGTLQGYTPALHYIEDQALIPLKMLNITNTQTC